jgi:hypothetical protein
MVLRRVFLVLLLRQVVMGWIQYLSTYYQMCMSSCGYVPSCQAPKATASRGPRVGNAYLLQEVPGCILQGARVPTPG